jgi:AmiR/NasT family two-component response regulator
MNCKRGLTLIGFPGSPVLEASQETMTAETLNPSANPQPGGEAIGVWLIQEADSSWEKLIGSSPGPIRLVSCGQLPLTASSLLALRHGPGEVLLVMASSALPADWLEQVRTTGKGVVVVSGSVSPEQLHKWARHVPVVFVPPETTAAALQMAIVSAEGMARREAKWRAEYQQVQQRLDDRVLLERAKGVLVQRFGLSEEDAYRRLRSMARRQRRALREVARAVLDTDCILDSPAATRSAIEEETQQ